MAADDRLGTAPVAAGRSMTVSIGFDAGEPPIGFVVGDDGVRVPFTGWLDLIHTISHLVYGRSPETAAGTRRAQPEPGA